MARTGTLYWLGVILEDEELDAAETLLMITLADHVNAKDECFVGIKTLAKGGRVSYATARRRLKALEEKGYITRKPHPRADGSNANSVYDYKLVRRTPALSVSGPPDHDDEQGPPAHPGERAEVPREEVPPEQDLAPAVAAAPSVPAKPTDDPLTKAAHQLAVYAYEQEIKPVVRGEFVTVLARLKDILTAGFAVNDVRAAIEAGPITWTGSGLTTAVSMAKKARKGGSVEDRVEANRAAIG